MANTVAEQVRIIEYDPSYAGALAEMWIRSSDSWGGGTIQKTKDSVLRMMEVSSHLHAFLAVDGGEVVGFCSFSHYHQDEGAMYVPLLNVRPDYHGCKVGRNLILKAVRQTVEAGWPRLDLFTWAGNTKAVPMYKKCGFFWEKNDDYVHLMNFIPTILQTEALAPYFEVLDWYADSTRELRIEPDGRSAHGFDFLDYTWRKGALALRAEFEKTGRGLTALDTPDYAISTHIDDHDLVFGSAYKVQYRIENRSAAAMTIEIKGQNNKCIRYALDVSQTIAPGETVMIEGEFELDPVLEEQNNKKTHPVVMSTWAINGKRAEFRIGIAPKFPVKMKVALQAGELYPGTPAMLYLNAENHFATEAEFSFDWPETDIVEWANRTVRFTVPAKGKAAIPAPFRLRSYGLLSHEVEVTAVPAGHKVVTFTSKLSALLKGTQGRYGGQNGDQWVAVNGAFSLHMNKLDNNMWIEYPGSSHNFRWSYPKLGKPFSQEFSKKQAAEVKIYAEGESQVLEALYESEDFSGLQIKSVAKLSANGIARFHYEICNTSSRVLEENMHLLTNFIFFGSRFILPYQGRYVDMGNSYSSDPANWDSAKITENWLFSKEENVTCGICWDPSLKLLRSDYPLGLEHELGRIAAGAAVKTNPVIFALNSFLKWSDFRSFARKLSTPVVPLLDNHLELVVGGGNPFAAGLLSAELIERKMAPLAGRLELHVQEGGEPERQLAVVELDREQHLHSAHVEISTENKNGHGQGEPVRKLRAVYHGEDWIQERSGLWFPQTDGNVTCEIEESAAGPVYTVNNGILSIAAAPGFGSVVHSLKHNGAEWLDTSYPEPVPHSWWNPWHGGLGVDIPRLGGFSREQEPRNTDWAEREDRYGNVWKGLRVTTSITKHEVNRGIVLHQHYLMLPGVPVLCVQHSVTNGSGEALPHYSFADDNFFKPSPEVFSEGWVEVPGQGRFLLGKLEAQLQSKGLLRIGAASRQDMLQVVSSYPNQSSAVYVNNKGICQGVDYQLSLLNGETLWTQPTFLVLGPVALNPEDVRGLLNLSFADTADEKEALHADH